MVSQDVQGEAEAEEVFDTLLWPHDPAIEVVDGYRTPPRDALNASELHDELQSCKCELTLL